MAATRHPSFGVALLHNWNKCAGRSPLAKREPAGFVMREKGLRKDIIWQTLTQTGKYSAYLDTFLARDKPMYVNFFAIGIHFRAAMGYSLGSPGGSISVYLLA